MFLKTHNKIVLQQKHVTLAYIKKELLQQNRREHLKKVMLQI